jgi:hypothetical protein
MLYAFFDGEGRVTGLTETPRDGAREVSLRDPEVMAFLSLNSDEAFDPDAFLDQSDKSTIRILEDLIDTLIGHHLIRFTDLPMAAQKKLLSRRLARNLVREENGESAERSDADEHQSLFLSDEDEGLF